MRNQSKTGIVFPRMSNKDGPAKTVNLLDYATQAELDSGINPLSGGIVDGDANTQGKRVSKELMPPIPGLAEKMNNQNFLSMRGSGMLPCQKTVDLINKTRGR